MAASIQNIIYQMVLAILRDARFTSASPGHVNTFDGLFGNGSTIATDGEFEAAIAEIVKGLGIETNEKGEMVQSESKDSTNKEAMLSKGVSSIVSVGNNPFNAMLATAIPLLPHTVIIGLAISMAPLIFEQLTRAGGPLDLRFKRMVSDEVSAYLSRQTQKDTEMGVRQVIIQAKDGFTASNGDNHYNTVRGIREGGLVKERLDRIGMVSHAKGVFD